MRYFIIFYRGMFLEKGPSLAKDLHLESLYIYDDKLIKSEKFPNKREFIREITDIFGLRWVHITQIIEVTEQEANDYYERF